MNLLYLFCSHFPQDWYSLFPPEAGKADAHISYSAALSLTFMGFYFQAAGCLSLVLFWQPTWPVKMTKLCNDLLFVFFFTYGSVTMNLTADLFVLIFMFSVAFR